MTQLWRPGRFSSNSASGLENPMCRRAWRATVHRAAKCWTWPSTQSSFRSTEKLSRKPSPTSQHHRPVIDIFPPCDKLAVWSGWWASTDILPLTKVHSFTLGFILCVHSFMSFDKYIMVSLHHYCIIQNSFTALKNLLCSNYSSLSTSPRPQVTDVLLRLRSSAFSWMTFQTGFSHFTMYTNTCLSFLRVLSQLDNSFFFYHLMMFRCLSSKFCIPWFQALAL